MTSNQSFFLSPQAAAVYKHELIKRYIPAWAGKVGSTSTGKRVVVYDAYSGPGRYEDEAPGSPEILVNTAVAMANLRSVFTVFSEKERGYCDRLLFVFLDPYGFTLPFDRMVSLLKGRDKSGHFSTLLQPKTEVLINFSF